LSIYTFYFVPFGSVFSVAKPTVYFAGKQEIGGVFIHGCSPFSFAPVYFSCFSVVKQVLVKTCVSALLR